jgi:hypothetical protein
MRGFPEVRYCGNRNCHFEEVVSCAVEENKNGCYDPRINNHNFQELAAREGFLS